MNISNGIIAEINREMDNILVTVEYGQNAEEQNAEGQNTEGQNVNGMGNRIRLVVDERTIILNRDAQEVMADDLEEGMIIDARTSEAMTRSIPPQATAYLIRIVRGSRPEGPSEPEPGMPQRPVNPPELGMRPPRPGNPPRPGRPPRSEDMTMGRIWNVDRNNRSFDTITGQDISTLTRFNVPEDARILNRMGRPMNFSGLMIGMRVQVRHANFMTASIPPQTTAFEVRVL